MPNQDQNPFSLERFVDDEINIQDGRSMDGGVRHTPLAQAQDAKGNIFRFVFLIFAVAATIGSAWETTLLVCRLLQVSCSLQAHIGMAPGGFNVTHLCEVARSFHNLPSTSAQDRTIKAHDERLKAVEDDIANILQIIPEPPLARRNFALRVSGTDVIPELTSPTHLLPAHTLKTRFLQWFRGHDFFHDHVNLPVVVLKADVSVGQCWEFLGSRGSIGLLLPDGIDIKDFSINHVSPPLISAQSAARSPRTMTLWGLLPVDENPTGELETCALSTFMRSKNPSLIAKRGGPFSSPCRCTLRYGSSFAPAILSPLAHC
ncbi:hypothetical protein BD779DRAFT_1681501 [Infundibulicybe gibba]|nr:hypothetical protein BD779DRAFT_1681501 [Infundibulicybe gibba]